MTVELQKLDESHLFLVVTFPNPCLLPNPCYGPLSHLTYPTEIESLEQ